MSLKFFLLLALATVGALCDDISELEFNIEGRDYSETVIDGDEYQVMVVPKQGLADHTMIMHDFEMRLTAFKDLTTRRCIVMPLNHLLVRVRGLIFKDRQSPNDAVPSNRNVMLDVNSETTTDIETEMGEKIAEMCQDFPTHWAKISVKESTMNISGRRFRRWGVSVGGSASTNGRSASGSANASAGSNSASSNAGSKTGGSRGSSSQSSGSAN